MHIFIIDAENHVTAYAAAGQAQLSKGRDTFVNLRELARLAARWPGTRMVEIWNKLPNAKVVRRFTDRRTAIRRIWTAVQDLKPSRSPQSRTTAPAPRGPRTKPHPANVREDTKTERIIGLLTRSSGATSKEIMEETNWQHHSVRAFISQLPRRFGFRIKSYKRDGERVYRVR